MYRLPIYHIYKIVSLRSRVLVHLYVDVDVANEFQGCGKRDRSEHQEKDVAGEESIAEKLNRLQCTGHVGSLVVVEQSVEQHKHSG